MATDEAVTPSAEAPARSGHPTGFWFFFWGEFAERSSYYGMRAILALYMVDRLGFSKEDGSTVVSLFIAACYLLPIAGGLIADNFLGKYWTIVGFSLPYLAGHFILGIENKYAVFGALALLAMGSGVIKPNISTLMGMTYDQQRPGQEKLRSDAFSWFYFAINFGAFISTWGVPYVRNNYGYQMAFLFPTVLMAVSLVIFAAGKRYYAVERIERRRLSPEEAAEDRRLKLETLGRIALLFLLVMFFWAVFDQSASTWVYFADTYMNSTLFGFATSADQIQGFNPLFIMILLPINLLIFNALAANGWRIRATDKITLGFLLTAVSMVIMSAAGFLAGQKQDAIKLTFPEGSLILPKASADLGGVKPEAGKPVAFGDGVTLSAADWAYDADKKKASLTSGDLTLPNGTVVAITDGRVDFFRSRGLVADGAVATPGVLEGGFKAGRYPIGPDTLVVDDAGKATVVNETPPPAAGDAPKVTLETVDWVPPGQRVTVWWQVLAYLILTMAEILISVTGLELAYVAAPPTMKSFVTACWLFTVFLANFAINAPISRLYPTMDPGVYFAMLAVALVIVAVAFLPIAVRFNRAMEQAKREREASVEGNSAAV